MNSLLIKLSALDFKKTLILGLVLGVAYYFGLYDDGSTIQTQVDQFQQQIATEQQRQAESDKSIKKSEQLKLEITEQEAHYKKLTAQLPKEVVMSEVLRIIDTMAVTSGVSIKGKEPKKAEFKKILEEVPIRVIAEGSFSELTMFLYHVMGGENVSRISSFAMTRPTGRDAKTRPLTMEVLFTNYRYLGEPESKEAGAVPPPSAVGAEVKK